jgi:transcriptional regulator with XRE-family HTH domain
MTPQEGFVSRLRWYRQRNRVTLDQIASETRVQRELLEAFENNDLSQWPKGVYARAWVRGYASAVGLDPVDTVDEFCRLFPQGDRRLQGTIQDMAAVVAAPSEYQDDFPHEERRRSPSINMMPRRTWHQPITQLGKTLMIRLNALKASPYLKPRRDPRTSS